MSGLFGSTTIPGNRITDFANTSAEIGIPIPWGYGRFVTSGNVIWAPLPPVEHRHRKRQGKGGVKTEEFTYTLSYGVAFCRGPIAGFLWIKRNGKVVWTQDPNAPIEDHEYAAKWRQRVTFYLGTKTQMPDSVIESYEGMGRVSAHRDLAYIVVEDDDVTDQGGAVPSYQACVIRGAAKSYTTPPYPVYVEDGLGMGISGVAGTHMENTVERFTFAMAAPSGQLRNVKQYYEAEPHSFELSGLAPLGGEIKDVKLYLDVPHDSFKLDQLTPIGGGVRNVVVTYGNYEPESLEIAVAPLGGGFI